MNELPDCDEVCRLVAERHNGETLLSFSCGKDSLAAWLQLRRHFKKIVPFYLYYVPGLKFVEDYLAYCEDFFGCRIMRLPHPALYRWLRHFVFQPPERLRFIERAELPEFDYNELHILAREDAGLAPDCPVAQGVRMTDSLNRRATIRRQGVMDRPGGVFYPVWDWNKARVLQEIKDAGLRLSIDYELFGRSFDGLDYRFIGPLKERLPEDYRQILEWFPLVELEVLRHEWFYLQKG